MKIYYIDESMFQTSHFSSQILYRFERILSNHPGSLICISVTGEHNDSLERFISSQETMRVLMSPSLFDYGEVKGNLHTTFLAIENFPAMESYSGSIVEFDTNKKSVQRIYLEMFIHYDDIDIDLMMKEVEEILNEKIHLFKKKIMLN